MNELVPRARLLQLFDQMMRPKANGLTEQTYYDVLLSFFAGCPDPVGARWLVVECLDPMTNEELVKRALAMPTRLMANVPSSELPAWHPLRRLAS